MHDVFISYSTMDIVPAEKIRDILEQNKIPCWMAPRDIPSGSNYAKEIPVAIRECKVFLLILSANAQSSNWVVKELDNAVNAGKIIIPLMLEDCPLNDEFNFLLTGAQRYTSYRRSEETLKMLIKQIQAITGIESQTETKPEKEEGPGPETKPVVNEKTAEETQGHQKSARRETAVPVVQKAKPEKVRRKQEKVPFVFGKTETLAALAIPVMVVLPLAAYLLGNLKYFYWNKTMFFQPDDTILAIYAVGGLVLGTAMWWEWIRFRHREKKENPEAPACPSCGNRQARIIRFRTLWMTGKERCTLLLVPIVAALTSVSQPVVMRPVGRYFRVYYFTELQLQCMRWTGAVQGLIIGCWVANLLVRHLRRRAGLRSAACRCCKCRAAFLPVRQKN